MWTPPKYDLRREQGKLVVRYAVTLAALLVVALVTVGCEQKGLPSVTPQYKWDQTKRTTIFMDCLKALPAGPQSTKYNDWDEVVNACESAAYYQSRVCVANCESSTIQ